MSFEKQIQKLLRASKKVIKDCALTNGALVAANSRASYFPKEAKNYYYVWPRDGAYTCMAAKILGIKIQEPFFEWCMHAQGWPSTGLFYEKYYVNGKKALGNFQPDQTGSILCALHDYYQDKGLDRRFEKLLIRSANALCQVWKKNHFNKITQDLWEEKYSFPDLKESFSYSLAICSKGLACAYELLGDKKWLRVSNEMKKQIHGAKNKRFTRSVGEFCDQRVDASLLGLVWPSACVDPKDPKMLQTIKDMEKTIAQSFGVHRYENDDYDGWMYKKNIHRKKGAGYWPLLNFWMSIYYCEKKDRKKALSYYKKPLEDVSSSYLPEQVFDNPRQKSVSPLAWSHAMFVIASQKLGFLGKRGAFVSKHL